MTGVVPRIFIFLAAFNLLVVGTGEGGLFRTFGTSSFALCRGFELEGRLTAYFIVVGVETHFLVGLGSWVLIDRVAFTGLMLTF
jgi:hypothetical protein